MISQRHTDQGGNKRMEHIIEKGTISCFEQDLFEQERAQETIGDTENKSLLFPSG